MKVTSMVTGINSLVEELEKLEGKVKPSRKKN